MRLLTTEEKAEIERLYERGLSHQAIAIDLALPETKLRTISNGYGVTDD